jgi:hypothetical protein
MPCLLRRYEFVLGKPCLGLGCSDRIEPGGQRLDVDGRVDGSGPGLQIVARPRLVCLALRRTVTDFGLAAARLGVGRLVSGSSPARVSEQPQQWQLAELASSTVGLRPPPPAPDSPNR